MHETHKAAGLRVSPHRNPSANSSQFQVQIGRRLGLGGLTGMYVGHFEN